MCIWAAQPAPALRVIPLQRMRTDRMLTEYTRELAIIMDFSQLYLFLKVVSKMYIFMPLMLEVVLRIRFLEQKV